MCLESKSAHSCLMKLNLSFYRNGPISLKSTVRVMTNDESLRPSFLLPERERERTCSNSRVHCRCFKDTQSFGHSANLAPADPDRYLIKDFQVLGDGHDGATPWRPFCPSFLFHAAANEQALYKAHSQSRLSGLQSVNLNFLQSPETNLAHCTNNTNQWRLICP